MKFREWLKTFEETSTSTGDIAVFARPAIYAPQRMYPDTIIMDKDDERKKQKRKKNM